MLQSNPASNGKAVGPVRKELAKKRAEIIAALDIKAEFTELGIRFAKGQPRQSGMISCYAYGRDDRNPSAWVNVKTGQYGDKSPKSPVGEKPISIFDFRVHVGKAADLNEAFEYYALKTGVIKQGSGKSVTIVKTTNYDYHDATGQQVLYRVVRRDMSDGTKRFIQQRPNGKGGFINGLNGTPATLYDLPAVVNAHPKAPVFIVEGEKAKKCANKLGLVATCNSGGAKRWQKGLVKHLKKRWIIILVDNDADGEAWAQKAAETSHGTARRIQIIKLPGLPEGGDIVEWVAAGGTVEKLKEIVKATPDYKPKETDFITEDDPSLLTYQQMVDAPNSAFKSENQGHGKTAERLLRNFGDDLLFVKDWQRWITWNGKHWVDDKNKGIHERAWQLREIVDEFRTEAQKLAGDKVDEDEFKEIEAYLKNLDDEPFIGRVVNAASEKVTKEVVTLEQINKRSSLLNVENGTINLETSEFREHRREDLLMCSAPVEYDSKAFSPLWDKFMLDIFDHDEELVEFVRRAIGYSLTGDVRERKLFFCFGDGANGKSTMLNLLQSLLGDLSVTLPQETLMMTVGEAHPTEIASLHGKRLAVTSETSEGRSFNEPLVKSLCGGEGEKVSARRMREDYWQFDPSHKLWVAGNHKPTIHGTDDGIWDRIILIPFKVRFEGDRLDKSLPEKLAAEKCGILNWCIAGAKAWYQNGMQVPESVKAITDEYRQEQDTVRAFIASACVVGPDESCPMKNLWMAYEAWLHNECRGKGLGPKQFSQALTRLKFYDKRKSFGMLRLGIGLKAA